MQRQSSQSKSKAGVQLFSDMMLMKFKPKNMEGIKTAKQSHPVRRRMLSEDVSKLTPDQQVARLNERLNHIKYLELASNDTVIVGNVNQIDMINLDGLAHNFVDTFHYWSLNISKPILDVKINLKKQLFLLVTNRNILLYSYSSLKKQKVDPIFITTFQVKDDVKYIQFPTSDLIAIFYENYLEIYSLNDANLIQKKLQKKYGIQDKFKLFAVPQAIDSTINIFFEQVQQKKKTFGLWEIEINLQTQNIKLSPAYKIYDIMKSLKKILVLQNYSKDIVFLNLGQQILIAKKGYIIDSVNINLQIQDSYLKYLPSKQILVHIQKNVMQIYKFSINVLSIPHRIQLQSLDSIQIRDSKAKWKLINVLPMFDQNYALFYEDTVSNITTKGQIFYSFVVSHTVNIAQKINRILQTQKPISEIPEEQIQVKCDILRKIGLNDQQIYLQIWRRSTKSTVKDFQFILATGDYKTIKQQIEAKLKKQSMSFKQIYKIQQSCRDILKPKINGQGCTQQLLKDYLTCNLLLRKLQLFRELHILNTIKLTNEERIFYMNIQDYYTFKNTQLKNFVLERINQFLFNKKDIALEIRVILNHFRFVYRFIYLDLLDQIIKISKNQLRKLIQAIPQLLPVDSSNNYQQSVLFHGVWRIISQDQWQHGMYLQKIININNKQAVQQFIGGLWFKRNWLTSHDLIASTMNEIEQRNKKNNSVQIFYFFIDKTFQNVKDELILRQILSFLQKTYPNFPEHLRNRVLLYSKLFKYYNQNYQILKCPKFSFGQFLNLRDYNLFKYFFDFQKVKKNSLLKQIKPIYESVDQVGSDIFNLSLFNYFKSDISQISNLKYLLNRINNQKKQFHAIHQKMYQILIRAMQIKLKIGSSNDIPVDEVLIYVQNIPIGKQNKQMINQLQIIQKISQESAIFKKMRINMTIRQLIDNYETVIQKMVDYEIKKNQIMRIDNKNVLMSRTYRILAEIQSVKDKIYGPQYNELALFIYITKILEREDKIGIAQNILNDEHLNNYYFIDLKIIQSLVLYMYHWKFSQNATFTSNQKYFQNILQLLPQDNPLRNFIKYQLKFALLLSTPSQPVTFPISPDSKYPRVLQLQELVKFIDNKHLVLVNIEEVVESMKKMQQLHQQLNSEQNRYSAISKTSLISQKLEDHTIYQTFINVFIARGLMKEVIPLLRKSIAMASKLNVTTTLIMIYNLIPQLNGQSKITLTKITSFLYRNPLELLDVIELLLTNKFTGLQAIDYLHKVYDQIKKNNYNYDEENLIFNLYFQQMNEEPHKEMRKILVQNCLVRLKKIKPQFLHDFAFDFIYIILCYEPFNIAIFLKNIESSKWKHIRNFVSYLVQEEIFDEVNTLQLFRRVFYILLKSNKDNIDIYKAVHQYGSISLVQEFTCKKLQDLNDYQKKILKNVNAFERKKLKITGLDRSMSHSNKHKKYILIDKEVSIKQSLKNPDQNKDRVSQYVFSDSDDNYNKEEEPESPKHVQKRKKHSKIKFDPKLQRKEFIRKDNIQSIQVRRQSPNRKSPESHDEKKELINSSRIKKYFSMDVRSGYDSEQGERVFDDSKIESPSPKRDHSPFNQNPCRDHHIIQQKSMPYMNDNDIKRKQMGFPDDFPEEADDSCEPTLKVLKVQNKKSQEQVTIQRGTAENEQTEVNVGALLKKLYKTYSEKLQAQPYNLKLIAAQKSKGNFKELLKKIIKRVYTKPDRNLQISFKLIGQIANKYPESQINLINVDIFQKIAKFEMKYGLQLPMQVMLPLQGLYFKNQTADKLFDLIKTKIMQVTDDQNLFKISKLISIGFKKNNLEQQIILLYLDTLIDQINKGQNDDEQINLIQKIKGLINKIQVRVLVEKVEGIVDRCTHFDARRKLVQLFIDTIRLKGNGKDAKQLSQKLK